MDNSMIENIAKKVNVSADIMRQKAEAILAEQGGAWKNAGKSDDDCNVLALRVAARQLTTEQAALSRSGAVTYEGMFVSVPRSKEWGKILYNKMSNQLRVASEDVRQSFVDNGTVVLFEDNHDGSFTRHSKQDYFGAETADVTELPRHTQRLDDNTHFYVVWDKSNKTFPSGDANFKYGRPRPQDERERTMLFLGRPTGDNSDLKLITVKATQAAADVQYPTFVPCTFAMRPNASGTVAYVKPKVSVFTPNQSVASIFDAAPVEYDGKIITGGIAQKVFGLENTISGLDQLGSYYDMFNGKDGWWDRSLIVVGEVIHIDPRDNGGYVLMVSDVDIMSSAEGVEIYVPSEQDDRVDFAVGTKVLMVGQAWRTKEGEDRMSVNGWYAFDTIAPVNVEDDAGWDE